MLKCLNMLLICLMCNYYLNKKGYTLTNKTMMIFFIHILNNFSLLCFNACLFSWRLIFSANYRWINFVYWTIFINWLQPFFNFGIFSSISRIRLLKLILITFFRTKAKTITCVKKLSDFYASSCEKSGLIKK